MIDDIEAYYTGLPGTSEEKNIEYRTLVRRIITRCYGDPFFKVVIKSGYHAMYVTEEGSIGKFNFPGLYVIYQKMPNGFMRCLYVGSTSSSCTGRLGRFNKELAGQSRRDESHYGARKCRLNGIRLSDDLYVKVVSLPEILAMLPEDIRDKIELSRLDEVAAYHLNALFNARKVYS